VRFKRPKTMAPLPIPESGGSWDDLFKLLNLSDRRSRILVIGWLLQAYWPKGPFAHLVLTGEQGSGKSGLTKILKMLVDPSIATLRRPPREERDLMIAAQAERIIAYDNLSGLAIELSDGFCVLSTGGCLAGRKLYSDDEEAVLLASRPVILNGIDAIATRGDLLDRSVLVDLPRITEKARLRDSDLAARFAEIHPQILGLILNATVMGLKREDSIDLPNLPRMADFATWVAACEPALPWNEGEFMQIYEQAAQEALIDLIETDSFANAMLKLVEDVGTYEGTPTALWNRLIDKGNINLQYPPHGWPKGPRGIANKLKRISPQLRVMDIKIYYSRSGKKGRNIKIVKETAHSDDKGVDGVDVVSIENRHTVTTVSSVSSHSQLSLENSVCDGEERAEEHQRHHKEDGRNLTTPSTLASQNSESYRHSIDTGSSPSSSLDSDLKQAESRIKEKEEHFSKVAKKYVHMEDIHESGNGEQLQVSDMERIRIACTMEYGLNGWVDPRKVAAKLKINVDEIDNWLKQNYDPSNKPGGIGYKQRQAAHNVDVRK
jgi:energy-coupling factor transporter ATP-binding protein EcfA2